MYVKEAAGTKYINNLAGASGASLRPATPLGKLAMGRVYMRPIVPIPTRRHAAAFV